MTTPPIDKGKGKQLFYSRENSPRLSPIQRPRYTSSPPTAVIRPGDSTPSPISPNVAEDFAITSSAPLQRMLSSESSKLRTEIEINPEPIVETESTPPSQHAVREEPAVLIKSEDESRQSTPLDRYWSEDRRKRMFRAELNPEPTEPKPIKSPYERKFVKTRPSTPTKDEPEPSRTTAPKPETQGRPATTLTPIRHYFKDPKRSPSPPPPRGPSPPRPPTPPSPPSRGPSPGPLQQQPNLIQRDDEPLQGKEPPVFEGDRQKTDHFLHELRLYQFVNATHPVMVNPWQKVAHALTYVSGPNVYEWKRSAENWILSIPAPSAPNRTIYEDFEEEFIESWTDTNEPYRAAADLDRLRMRHDNIDEYITRFAELARKALYHEDDPAVLEKFKAGLPLELLEPCMHHDEPRNWDAWTWSACKRQAILTSIKTHRPIEPSRTPSPMEHYSSSPPSSDPTVPMELDKMYTIPMRRTSSEEERRRGLCHLCKEHRHIQRHCPRKTTDRAAATRTFPAPPKRTRPPQPIAMNQTTVLQYLKNASQKVRDWIADRLATMPPKDAPTPG